MARADWLTLAVAVLFAAAFLAAFAVLPGGLR